MKKKLSHEERYNICKECPNLDKRWKVCKLCNCFMPLKTKLRWAECPEEPPRWTQGENMPSGKGTYGKTRGRPKKKKGGKKKKSMGGLTAAQKKLPKALQQAILKRKRGKKKK